MKPVKRQEWPSFPGSEALTQSREPGNACSSWSPPPGHSETGSLEAGVLALYECKVDTTTDIVITKNVSQVFH